MKTEESIIKLKEQQKNGDQEQAHVEADKILCDLLIYLGYQDVVDEFEKIEKWYA